MEGGNSFLSTQQEAQKARAGAGTFQSKQLLLHTSATLSRVTSGSRTAAYSCRKKSSGAKRLWAYSGLSGDYCCERVCVGLLCETETDREKVGQGKRGGKSDGQPQLSASVNVLTAHLNISVCHELFVSPNVCLFVCEHVCVC